MPNELRNLFDLDFDAERFAASASGVVAERDVRVVNKRVGEVETSVKNIVDSFPTVSAPSQEDLEQIRRKFNAYKQGPHPMGNEIFDNIAIRKMCYFANQFASTFVDYKVLQELIELRWKPSFLNGLVFCLMYNWKSFENDIDSKLFRKFIIRQLEEYQGNRRHLCALKCNVDYLNDGGPIKLASTIVSRQQKIQMAPSILGLKESELTYSYFSKAICYFYKNTTTVEDEIREVLNLHSNVETSKIVLADKIIRQGEKGDLTVKNVLKRLAVKFIGDPFVAARWNTIGMNEEDADNVKKAHSIIKKWLIADYIDLAFEKLIDDPYRKRFWMKLVNYIDDVKIVGSPYHWNIISHEEELREALQNCFRRFGARTSTRNCSVAIKIKQYTFVEFSGIGCCYAYDDDSIIKKIEDGQVWDESDLKDTTMDYFVSQGLYGLNMNPNGKARHGENWEYRFGEWFWRYLKIDVMGLRSSYNW